MNAEDKIIEFAANFRPITFGIPEGPLNRLLPGLHFDPLAKAKFMQEQQARQRASLLRSFLAKQRKRQQLTVQA